MKIKHHLDNMKVMLNNKNTWMKRGDVVNTTAHQRYICQFIKKVSGPAESDTNFC